MIYFPLMKIIETSNAPAPLGHYSQAIVENGLVFVSGQLGIDIDNPDNIPGDVSTQAEITLKNLAAVLDAAGSSKDKVVKTTIFISDVKFWADVNKVYADFFGDHKPARSAVPTRDLPKGFLVEIEAIATVK
jgi:2-iminobutanoate/2-iminopropanoate deaminase